MCFCSNLKKIRNEKGVSQKQLADLIGVAPSTYSQYESGKREPDVLKIKAIANVLNISADYLLFGTDNPFSTKNEAYSLYDSLDKEDQAEVRGVMKQMLKAEKYTDSNNTISSDIAGEIRSALKKIPINTK